MGAAVDRMLFAYTRGTKDPVVNTDLVWVGATVEKMSFDYFRGTKDPIANPEVSLQDANTGLPRVCPSGGHQEKRMHESWILY